MVNDICFNLVATVTPGKFDAFKTFIGPVVEMTKREPGCLGYELTVSSDHSTVYMFERFRDSNAIVHHIAETFSKCAKEFGELVTVTNFVIFGDPNEEVRTLLAGAGAIYTSRFDGFTR